MYLGVAWLSDICSMDGTLLVDGIWDDAVDLSHENMVIKPAQNKPNTQILTL